MHHCATRLGKGQASLERLRKALTFGDAESAWSDLLLSGNAVYTKLEQGSKFSGHSNAWFGRRKKERKDDPLLSYMLHARNSDEHSIEDITRRVGAGEASFTIIDKPEQPFDPMKLAGMSLHVDLDHRGHVKLRSSDETRIATTMHERDTLILTPVRDRGQTYNPPTSHAGAGLDDLSPVAVGSVYLAYLGALIAEARSLGI